MVMIALLATPTQSFKISSFSREESYEDWEKFSPYAVSLAQNIKIIL